MPAGSGKQGTLGALAGSCKLGLGGTCSKSGSYSRFPAASLSTYLLLPFTASFSFPVLLNPSLHCIEHACHSEHWQQSPVGIRLGNNTSHRLLGQLYSPHLLRGLPCAQSIASHRTLRCPGESMVMQKHICWVKRCE